MVGHVYEAYRYQNKEFLSKEESDTKRIVGHPDLKVGASYHCRGILYISFREAIYREMYLKQDVEIHFESTEEDEDNLGEIRIRFRANWAKDDLPDGWKGRG